MRKELTILYEDDQLLVVKKPAGLAVQTAKLTEPDMLSELKKTTASKGTIYIVHRLDQPVAGLMVFAKTKAAAAALSSQVQKSGGMNKDYLAVVYGHMAESHGVCVDWLLRDGRTNTSRVVSADMRGAKRAELQYEELSRSDRTSLLRIKLLSGRHHQIRVQLSSRGTPILGDKKYGSAEAAEYTRENGITSLCLNAVGLAFTHPKTGDRMRFYDDACSLRSIFEPLPPP